MFLKRAHSGTKPAFVVILACQQWHSTWYMPTVVWASFYCSQSYCHLILITQWCFYICWSNGFLKHQYLCLRCGLVSVHGFVITALMAIRVLLVRLLPCWFDSGRYDHVHAPTAPVIVIVRIFAVHVHEIWSYGQANCPDLASVTVCYSLHILHSRQKQRIKKKEQEKEQESNVRWFPFSGKICPWCALFCHTNVNNREPKFEILLFYDESDDLLQMVQ